MPLVCPKLLKALFLNRQKRKQCWTMRGPVAYGELSSRMSECEVSTNSPLALHTAHRTLESCRQMPVSLNRIQELL